MLVGRRLREGSPSTGFGGGVEERVPEGSGSFAE
jgi:hypothetical protein